MGRYILRVYNESIVTEEIAHENKGLGTLRKPDELFGGERWGEKRREEDDKGKEPTTTTIATF
jgi:hypothetical protein